MKPEDLKEAKLACRVAETWDGQAHLFEHRLDAHGAGFTTVWYGVIHVICSREEEGRLWGQVVRLDFEDGRVGMALILDVSTRIDLIAQRGEVPVRNVLACFVGISTLDRADAVKGPGLPGTVPGPAA